jgi:hypothetical protein
MRKTNLIARIKALEDAARCPEPCTYEQHRDLLLEILQRRAVPLPPLDDVDLLRTANLWASDVSCKTRSFILLSGEVVTSENLARLNDKPLGSLVP